MSATRPPHIVAGAWCSVSDPTCTDHVRTVLDDLFNTPEAPEAKAAYAELQRRMARIQLVFGWTRKIPLVGSVVWVFWSNLFDEGLYQTVKPRWGALTFSFLNDGMKPTLWHTWRQITHDNADKYTGIYVSGAPHSLAEALEWDDTPPDNWRHNHGRSL